jgi:hypothetical protein
VPDTSTIEITDGLRNVVCHCREVFAIARLLYLKAAVERLPIFCPLGHSFTPGDPDNPSSDAILNNVELTAALHDSRRLAQSLALRLTIVAEAGGASATIDKKEIKRRAKLLGAKSLSVEYGRRPCPFCGDLKRNIPALVDHMIRIHPGNLSELDPTAFDPLGGGGGGV